MRKIIREETKKKREVEVEAVSHLQQRLSDVELLVIHLQHETHDVRQCVETMKGLVRHVIHVLHDAYVTGIAKVTFMDVIPLRIASFAGATIATALGKSNTLSVHMKIHAI